MQLCDRILSPSPPLSFCDMLLLRYICNFCIKLWRKVLWIIEALSLESRMLNWVLILLPSDDWSLTDWHYKFILFPLNPLYFIEQPFLLSPFRCLALANFYACYFLSRLLMWCHILWFYRIELNSTLTLSQLPRDFWNGAIYFHVYFHSLEIKRVIEHYDSCLIDRVG